LLGLHALSQMAEQETLPDAPAWFGHRVDGRRHLGVVNPRADGSPWRDLGALDEAALLAAGKLDTAHVDELTASGEVMDAAPVFDVPVARPRKILCLGKNFSAHAAEFGAEVPEEPIFFCKLTESLLPHRGTVLLPHWLDSRVDHEIELGLVLGFDDPDRQGRADLSPEQALDLVAGFTIINDVTARRLQGDDRGEQKPWLRCKSFNTFCPVGPWVVPAGSLPEISKASISLSVGDEQRQRSSLDKMVVGIRDALAYLSRHTTLHSGDLIAMGTPAGVGPLQPGDRMVGAIDGLGALINSVERQPAPA